MTSAFNPLILASIAFAGSVVSLAYTYSNNSDEDETENANINDNEKKNNDSFSDEKTESGLFPSSNVDSNVREAKPSHDQEYYQKVYNAIAKKLIDVDDYDYGSYAPLLVRLAWHNSGSYDQNDTSETKGGSYAGTMRFKKEQGDPENAGLVTGMQFLQSIKDEFPDLSHGDLYTLGGVVGIQEMSGPKVGWRPGRVDLPIEDTPPYHRLPDASQTTSSYLRSVFTERLGFTDKELVCLIGVGHSLGRCHVRNSGYGGPWTFSPTTVTTAFFRNLLENDWKLRNWCGKKQYQDQRSHCLMMLPTDMVLKQDSELRKYVEEYAHNPHECMKDFADVFNRLLERGIKFNVDKMYFKTLKEQKAKI